MIVYGPAQSSSSLTDDDSGPLEVMIGVSKDAPGCVVISFRQQIVWFGLPPTEAHEMARALEIYASAIERGHPTGEH